MHSRLSNMLGTALAAIVITASSLSAQGFRSDDPVLRAMWQEGMEQSQTESLAQVLMDYIGPRLSGTPNFHAAVDWLEETYGNWGVDVRREQVEHFLVLRQRDEAVHILTAFKHFQRGNPVFQRGRR